MKTIRMLAAAALAICTGLSSLAVASEFDRVRINKAIDEFTASEMREWTNRLQRYDRGMLNLMSGTVYEAMGAAAQVWTGSFSNGSLVRHSFLRRNETSQCAYSEATQHGQTEHTYLCASPEMLAQRGKTILLNKTARAHYGRLQSLSAIAVYQELFGSLSAAEAAYVAKNYSMRLTLSGPSDAEASWLLQVEPSPENQEENPFYEEVKLMTCSSAPKLDPLPGEFGKAPLQDPSWEFICETKNATENEGLQRFLSFLMKITD